MALQGTGPGPSRPGFPVMRLCYGCARYRAKHLFRSSCCCWCQSAATSKRRAIAHGYFGPHFTGREWELLVERFGCCLCCGEAKVKLTVDHVVPLVKGGGNSIANIQPLCRSCNCSKGQQEIDYRPG